MKLTITLLLTLFSFSLFALPNSRKYKKVKVKLYDNTKFKGYIVKSDKGFLYTVNSKKQLEKALDDNCKDCQVTKIAAVKKISRAGLIWGAILAILGVGFAWVLYYAESVTGGASSSAEGFGKNGTIFGLIGFGIGYFIGDQIDN